MGEGVRAHWAKLVRPLTNLIFPGLRNFEAVSVFPSWDQNMLLSLF